MAKIHDKFVIELAEVIKGFGNDYRVYEPFNLPCMYRFYEIDGVALSEDSFLKMTPLNDYMEWIPCSEREPERSGEYMITWTGYIGGRKSKPFLEIAEFSFDYMKSEWDVTHIAKRGYYDIKVVAWKELGEPWEGDNDEITE